MIGVSTILIPIGKVLLKKIVNRVTERIEEPHPAEDNTPVIDEGHMKEAYDSSWE